MQAEIDSACEAIDFLRFNVQFMTDCILNNRFLMQESGTEQNTDH